MGDVTGARPALRLRPLTPADEDEARTAHQELVTEDFSFLLGLEADEPWSLYLARLEDMPRGVGLPAGWVPGTFLVAEVGGQIVGRVSVRHVLNAFLAELGGHIGYAVRPGFRRRGYATEILHQSLDVAKSVGIDRVLVTCDTDNAASAAVIERCGGVFENVAPGRDGSASKRRYWIAVDAEKSD